MNDRKKCPWCMEYACDHRKEMWELRDNIRRLEEEICKLRNERNSERGGCSCGVLYPRSCEKCGGEISDPCREYEKYGLVVCSNCGNE